MEGQTDVRHGGGLRLVDDDDASTSAAGVYNKNAARFTAYDDAGPLPDGPHFAASFDGKDRRFTLNGARAGVSPVPPGASCYSRICAKADPATLPDVASLGMLAEAMMQDAGGDLPRIAVPPAFTYLGQFIAHDISRMVEAHDGAVVNLNTGGLDLDSVFGQVPAHLVPREGTATIDGVGLGRTGESSNSPLDDLPRTVEGEAAIPDPRNDHNVAVAQTHVMVARFYHAIARHFPRAGRDRRTTIARRHFQAVVLFDYLPRVVDRSVYYDVLANGRVIVYPDVDFSRTPFLVPLEFAVACFRFGHSMIAHSYQPWSHQQSSAVVETLIENTFAGGALTEARVLDNSWVTDWKRVLKAAPRSRAGGIDTRMVDRLFSLPRWLFDDHSRQWWLSSSNLAARTLLRGHALAIPTAQSIIAETARRLGSTGRRLKSLTNYQIAAAAPPMVADCLMLRSPVEGRLADATPLWFYMLREAEVFNSGRRLGPLASRIVVETLHAAMQASPDGIIDHRQRVSFKADARLSARRPDHYTLREMVSAGGLV